MPTLAPEVVSTGFTFVFTYMCTHFLHCIQFPIPFPNTSTLLLVPALPLGRTCSALLFTNFVGEKIKLKMWNFNFFEIKLSTQKYPIFHVYMYYNPNWAISSNFLHSVLVPLLC
jgi:hypothetical protein